MLRIPNYKRVAQVMNRGKDATPILLSAKRHGTLEYCPAIDGLRAIAVLAVFIFHLNHQWLPGGFVGVDVFLVISGYLMTSIILKECENGSFSLSRFYQRRIARIFPVFFTMGMATLAGAYFIYSPMDLALAGVNLGASALFVANLKFMLAGNYFEIPPDAHPFLHCWSLSVEEQFYILFPVLVLLMFKYARKHFVLILGFFCAISFLACVMITPSRPAWAFYLLPTRAWELLAGGLLALWMVRLHPPLEALWMRLLSISSLGLIALSFLVVHEGPHFPGFWALLPVVGTLGTIISSSKRGGTGEKRLASFSWLLLIGRMSYSLYLWHWPIFSLVDYKMYFASESVRITLKIGLSFLSTFLTFWFIENPARTFLNRRDKMALAYGSLFCAVALCVSLGYAVRRSNYITATFSNVPKGGLVFDSKTKTNSVILMGDSNASMYGKTVKEICASLGWKLTVLSVNGSNPLPTSNVLSGQLWLDSFAVVRREKPDCVVLACRWDSKLKYNKGGLALAVEALKPQVGRLLILNQPPILPEHANRNGIREGARPPFYEDSKIRRQRVELNAHLEQFNSGNCSVIDIASHFQSTNGEIFFLDGQGRQLYSSERHLSGFGAEFVRSELQQAISLRTRNRVQ